MVRVFRCLRFVSQNVVSPTGEPTVICSDGDSLFVACDDYNIEEFRTDKDGCHKVRRFAAIGRILQMAYSQEGEFLATVEEDFAKSNCAKLQSQLSLRVYTNLAAISSGHPMKVRIAGQVTRAKARHTGPVLSAADQLVVIEVPLKRPAACIATCGRNIAVGIKDTVLVYACDRIDEMSQDVRCILELEFGFKARRIELCEEFIMCSSGMECQIVQLNFNASAKSEIGGRPSRMEGPLSVRNFFEHDALRLRSSNKAAKSFQATELNDEFISNKCVKCSVQNGHKNPQMIKSSACEHCQKTEVTTQNGKQLANGDFCKEAVSEVTLASDVNSELTESKRHLVVRQTPVASCRSNSPLLPPPHIPQHKPQSKLKETIGGGVELLGPVAGDLSTCAVNVEYEGTEKTGTGRSGVLSNGVTTLLFKKLDYCSPPIHSIQLLPVFLDRDDDSSDVICNNVFVSAKRRKLVGLFGVIGTPNYAFVYSLLYDCRLISSFPYAVETLQVRLTENHLFALSSSRLDVYTSRCLSRIIYDCEETADAMQQTLPFISEEPCLIGYHTFLGLTAMCQMGDYVTILSKSTSSSNRSSDNSWSVYALRRPDVTSLYNDMIEHAKDWDESHPSAKSGESNERHLAVSLCLMQEANMLLRSQLYLRQWNEEKKELMSLLKKSSLYLAHVYEKCETDGHIAVPYYLMAGYSLMDIARSVRDSQAKISYRSCEALVWYATKLADPLTVNDIINEIANAGIANGYLKKLDAIAHSNDEVNSKRLSSGTEPSKVEVDGANETVPPSVGANLDSVTSLIRSDIEGSKSEDSLPQQLNGQVPVYSKENRC